MTMTQAEKLGFGKNLLELLKKEAATLKAAGYDADKMIAILTAKYETAALENARQEESKRTSRRQTVVTETATDDLYATASGQLDALIAAAGKRSDASRNFRRLRSRIRDPVPADGGAESVEPAKA